MCGPSTAVANGQCAANVPGTGGRDAIVTCRRATNAGGGAAADVGAEPMEWDGAAEVAATDATDARAE